jgi:phosphatidylserine decarboxylase
MHPEDLEKADRKYLVSWGRKEVARALLGTSVACGGILALGLFVHPLWLLLAVPVLLLGGFLVLFFRNPTRRIPSEPGVLVSPADGTVWDITHVVEEEYIQGPCICIGIFLSVFDVHVNRAPAAGRVTWVEHREGRYHDARSPAAARENESNRIGLVRDDEGGPAHVKLLVNQISGAIARRILCPLQPPVAVARGGLVGMIKYGSRTELYVPEHSTLELRVGVGDKVRAGSTVLAAWRE